MFAMFKSSRVLKSLSVAAVAAVGLVGAPQSEAHTIGARSGKPLDGNAACWSQFGPSVTNVCGGALFWNLQLLDPACGAFGCGFVTVTAQAAQFGSDVSCRTIGWSKGGTLFQSSGFFNPSQFGVPADINITTNVPPGGTQDVDCLVSPGSRLITVTW